jgi:uncharacterized protein YecE (DUF72 family)
LAAQNGEEKNGLASLSQRNERGKLSDEYKKHYSSIELNATHYKLYKPADLQKWIDKIKDKNFKFSPKVYQGIIHFGSFKDKQFLTDAFSEIIVTFGKHLGPVFLQVSDKFGPKRRDEFFEYLGSLPKDVQFFLEVRHPDWFIKPTSDELFDKLRQLKIGTVITDTAGRRDYCHMHLTIPKIFIRFAGNSLHKSNFPRIDTLAERMKYWLDNGIQEINFIMHMHDEATSPELTVYLVEKINKVCGLDLPAPTFIDGQPKLL